MAYYVRLLTPSSERIAFADLEKAAGPLRLVLGSEESWEKIEIYEPSGRLIAGIERHEVSAEGYREELDSVKDMLRGASPIRAREWILEYLSQVKTIYSFQLYGEDITREGWPLLGKVQNYLKDNLGGIIQADNEGFYNESGDYILWQMYEGAVGMIPAAVLDENGKWQSLQLRLDDLTSVERFKEGLPPKKGFFSLFSH